ncbi:MAG: hypothetical protein H0U87_04355 [Acidobacteria bacterium]|nr:hypothetical protein [Acidobacteriota bacterium]
MNVEARQKAREILKQYEKHGWTLRRVLLSDATCRMLAASLENLFGDAPIEAFKTDALWFSRAVAANGNESWELRRITGAPFALLRVFSADISENARKAARRATEKRLLDGNQS